jgi:hypothetical protein
MSGMLILVVELKLDCLSADSCLLLLLLLQAWASR